MNSLRLALLGLAVIVFAALGWRLAVGPSRPGASRQAVAAGPEVSEPAPPAVTPVPEPATPSPPPGSPGPVAPHAPSPPAAPTSPPAPSRSSDDDARHAILAGLQAAPDLLRVYGQIEAQFPAVAERSLAAAAAALRAGEAAPAPDDFLAATLRELRLSAGVLASRAGPDALAALFEVKAATLADLEAADPRICADYIFGGSSPEFNDFTIAHRALVARGALATITAMADGRTRQMRWDPPSDADYAMIETALRAKGLSADEIAAVLDGKSLDPPPSDTRLCDNARAYYAAMQGLPADARNRVYGFAADLLARS